MIINLPVTGITTCIDNGKKIRSGIEYIYMKRAYSRCISLSGGYPVLISPDIPPSACAHLCDALLITGGGDLPKTFDGGCISQEPTAELTERINWERELIEEFINRQKPILGICYGLQLLNLHFGGTLYEDIYKSIPYAVNHGTAVNPTEHYVEIIPGSQLHNLIGSRIIVSSSHHQGISTVAPGLQASAKTEDGLIEAIEAERILAVQWHPESGDKDSPIYKKFISLAK
jgi:putative glutamine amidotransferase